MPTTSGQPSARFASRPSISLDALRALRLRAQHLTPRRPRAALVEAVQALVGVNAQLSSAMALALRARVPGLTPDDLEAGVRARALVRTWVMRGTLHVILADDLEWLLGAHTPAMVSGGWRWLSKRAGLSRQQAEPILTAAYDILKAHGPMTRPALMAALAEQFGARVKPAAAGLVWLGGMLGRIAFGPDEGARQTYVALDQWLGRAISLPDRPDKAELARRYLRGHGPAEPRDLAAWSGLPLTDARAAWDAIAGELIELDVDGQRLWTLASESKALAPARGAHPIVRLLPAFDTYLLGYANRNFAVPPDHQARVFHGGQVVPVVLLDGLAVGTWRHERRGKQIRIAVTPWTAWTPNVRALVESEVEDIGRFFGLAAVLEYTRLGRN